MSGSEELVVQRNQRLLDHDNDHPSVGVLALGGAVVRSTLMREVLDLYERYTKIRSREGARPV
jgi:hypothetical protein